jgi:hypothetical protein
MPAPARPEVTQVIVHGVGHTPEEALHDALRTALRQALAAQVDAATWARSGQALFESVLRHSSGLILSCKELGASKEWRLLGALHHKDVAVEMNRRALVDRLRAARLHEMATTRVCGSPPVTWTVPPASTKTFTSLRTPNSGR